jgi:IS5 family transposase
MKERGLFDEIERLDELTKLGDPLLILAEKIKWETFRPILKQIRMEKAENLKKAGRKPFDEVVMFRVIILQSLYGLSDDQMEYQLKDRRSFERFVSEGEMRHQMPDSKTIWLYKERFKEHGIVRKVFRKFNQQPDKANLMAKTGQIVDASFVEVPRQRNKRDENEHIKKEGTCPDGWTENKKSRKDIEACWTEKNKQKHFGYKNHISADRKRKFIINYEVTSAEVHDSRVFLSAWKTKKKGRACLGG